MRNEKKEWSRPELIEHGDLEDLTRTKHLNTTDGFAAGSEGLVRAGVDECAAGFIEDPLTGQCIPIPPPMS